MDWNKRWLLRGIAFYLVLIAMIGGYAAFAQISVQTLQGESGPLRFDAVGRAILGTGHFSSAGPTPVLSGCGTGSPTIVGSNLAGTVVTGTSAAGCVITFVGAFATAPTCVLSTASGILALFSYTVSTTAITVTQTSTSGNTIAYVCIGKQ